jgi:hypothetical protein
MNTPTPRTDYLLSDYVTVDQLIDHAREIETELTAAREALKTGGMLNIIDRAHHERAAAIRERDEAREVLREIRDNEVNPEDEADKFLRDHVPSELSKVREQLTTVTEQRDRLAEALETAEPFMRHDLNCYARIGNAAYKCHCGLDGTQFLAKHALQSLTPNVTP